MDARTAAIFEVSLALLDIGIKAMKMKALIDDLIDDTDEEAKLKLEEAQKKSKELLDMLS